MQKIDYSDINKFLVSFGLILIVLAGLIPYLYYKEDFGIYLSQCQINNLETNAKSLFINKRNTIIQIQLILPWISLSLTLIGIVSIIIGLIRWFKRQAKIDEKFDKEIEKLSLEIRSLTPEEQEQKAKEEAAEIEIAEIEIAENLNSRISESYNKYIKIEKSISNTFSKYDSKNFKVLFEQKIGNRFSFDILLKAINEKYSDRIIEIKYFKSHLSYSIIEKTLLQLESAAVYYKQAARKQVVPVLLIIYNNKIEEKNISSIKSRLLNLSQNSYGLKRLKVEFIKETEIENFDVKKVLKR